jgi:hypothetical protein
LAKDLPDRRVKKLVCNDRATLAALAEDPERAQQGFREALSPDPQCEVARFNLTFLEDEPPKTDFEAGESVAAGPIPPAQAARAGKVAIMSFLFNWPSSGGGNVHTAEVAHFLTRAGYAVRHSYPRYAPWGIGNVVEAPFPSEALSFDEQEWNVLAILGCFRRAVDAFAPDYVLITDSWNMKPLLAEAVRGYPTILRFQATECLCPLKNVRLLPEPGGRCRQCNLDQLPAPQGCATCLHERGA